MPCGRCPHGAACCLDGAALSLDERDAIIAHLGAHSVVWDQDTVDDGWPGWRTATVAGDGTGCVFLDADKRCTIYEDRPLGCRTYFCHRITGPAKQPGEQTNSLMERLAAANVAADSAAAPRSIEEWVSASDSPHPNPSP